MPTIGTAGAVLLTALAGAIAFGCVCTSVGFVTADWWFERSDWRVVCCLSAAVGLGLLAAFFAGSAVWRRVGRRGPSPGSPGESEMRKP